MMPPAREEIWGMAMGFLQQLLQDDPSNTKLITLFNRLAGAQSSDEFFNLLGYVPNLTVSPSGDVWVKQSKTNENVMSTEDVAASILSGEGIYYGSGVFNTGGGSGGRGSRASINQSWGQASGGLYLWRIMA